MKQLSIVIVNYNVVHFLELCLSSVFEAIASLDAEVIVVDNASSDTSCEMIRNRFPEVVLLANKENVGFATANNQGVAIAKGEYVCILNPDTVVGEAVFNEVYAFAKSSLRDSPPSGERNGKANTILGAIGVKLVDGTGAFLPESKRNLPTPHVAFNKLFGDGEAYYASDIKPNQRGKVHVLVGAFMFMTRAVYLAAGGFDEQYFMYGEDIDLSHTITQLGFENYYLGDQTVVHFKGESTAKDKVYRKRFYNAMHIFYRKHVKSNWLEGGMVNFGLWCARSFFYARNSATTIQTAMPKKQTIISKNPVLIETIEKSLDTALYKEIEIPATVGTTEYLFDMELLRYEDCIKMMTSSHAQGATYKFIPKNSTFAIGSNSSDGRGKHYKW